MTEDLSKSKKLPPYMDVKKFLSSKGPLPESISRDYDLDPQTIPRLIFPNRYPDLKGYPAPFEGKKYMRYMVPFDESLNLTEEQNQYWYHQKLHREGAKYTRE